MIDGLLDEAPAEVLKSQLTPGFAREVVERLQEGMRDLPFHWTPQIPLAPLILSRTGYARMQRTALALLNLLREASWSLGATSAERAEQLGLAREHLPLFGDEATEWEFCTWQSRPDTVLTEHGPRFIEFNVSAAIGGIPHTSYIQRAWASIYAEHDLGYADPFQVRAAALDRLCARRSLDRSVAVVEEPANIQAEPEVWQTQVTDFRHRGFRSDSMQVEELAQRAAADGARYGIALKQFVSQDRLDAGQSLDPVVAAADAAELTLAPHSSYLLANKQTLALLSEGLPWMSDQDRRLVAEYVPWSRVVYQRFVNYRTKRWDLGELLVRERERFVLKMAAGHSGQGVLVGKFARPSDWADAVGRSLGSGSWIVQEYVKPASMPMRLWDVASEEVVEIGLSGVVSPYIVDGKDAGCMFRYDVLNANSVVTMTRPSTRFNTVMTA